MPDQITSCPICSSVRLRHFETLIGEIEEIDYLICLRCGAVFQSTRMGEEELQAFYQEGYRSLYQETEEPTKKDLIMQEERAQRTLRMIRDDVKDVARHLDIGSSSGALLIELQKAYKCGSVGIEPGDAYREFSRRQALEVYASLDLLPESSGHFDLVSMMHVLEHLPDPIQALSDLRSKYFSPDGFLLLEVPNLIEHEALELAHLFAFTPATLADTVQRSGFEVLWTRTHGSFRSPILNLYTTLLAKVSKDARRMGSFRSPVRWTKIQRHFGKLKRKFLTRFFPDWTWQSPPALWPTDELNSDP